MDAHYSLGNKTPSALLCLHKLLQRKDHGTTKDNVKIRNLRAPMRADKVY